ncbi:MAG: dephospho-CoA kinase [Clostridia bacterium]
MIIGLTGLTGAGKSTAAEILRNKGFHIIDGDKVGHRVTAGADVLDKIKAAFGGGVINPDGSLNRRALGKIVFSDSGSLALLNSITHPAIKSEVLREAEEHKDETVVVDGAVLKECGITENCAAVIRITAPEEVRLKRIMERDGLSEAEAKSRISAQTDHTDPWIDVDNSSTEENLAKNLEEALCAIKSKA